jgi:hypothetical protein
MNDITYTLYNDGVESTSSNIYVNNSVLTMVNISREDMGSYALQAENNGGSLFTITKGKKQIVNQS